MVIAMAICGLGLIACQSEKDGLRRSIERAEAEAGESPTLSQAEALIEQYRSFTEQYPGEPDPAGLYLYRAALLSLKIDRPAEAVSLLQRAVKEFYGSKTTPENIALLGKTFLEKLGKQETAITVFQALRQAFPGFKPEQAVDTVSISLPDRLKNMQIQAFSDTLARPDVRMVSDLISNEELYAMILPGDPQSPAFLHQAGEAARSIQAFERALDIYDWIGNRYPDYEKAPQALFLSAFTLDNDLKRTDEAKVRYEEFLRKYPDNEFAESARFLLENLGKSDEEIIRSFQENPGQ